MLQRLASRFQLLTGGPRDLPARQQTLRAAMEWSHGLLTGDEQKLFRRLGVFVNGCTLEAVEAVCDVTADLGVNVLDGMESLAGQSLIQQTQPPDGEMRFTMLETIREYAAERLASSPDEAMTRRAHTAYCLVLAEEGIAVTSPAEREKWLERCDLEHDNFRAALDWAVRAKQTEWGLRLGTALYPFWIIREHAGEGRERMEALLNLPASDKVQRLRAAAFHAAGDLASHHRGDGEAALQLSEQALAIYRTIGDAAGVVAVLFATGAFHQLLGNLEKSLAIFEECHKLSQEAGDELRVAQALNNQAYLHQISGDSSGAKPLCEQALEIFDRIQDLAGSSLLQSRLGDLERGAGNLTAAHNWYERALAGFEKLGDRTSIARTMVDVAVLRFEQGENREAYKILSQALMSFRDLGNSHGIARALEEYAGFAASRNEPDRALRLAGAADAIRHRLLGRGALSDRPALLRKLDNARRVLGGAALDAEMYGWSISIEAAIQYALNQEQGNLDD
jgi:tetratricopeptide (TPR) repeat protein